MPRCLWDTGDEKCPDQVDADRDGQASGKGPEKPMPDPCQVVLCSLETLGETRRNIWASADCQGLENKSTRDLVLARV